MVDEVIFILYHSDLTQFWKLFRRPRFIWANLKSLNYRSHTFSLHLISHFSLKIYSQTKQFRALWKKNSWKIWRVNDLVKLLLFLKKLNFLVPQDCSVLEFLKNIGMKFYWFTLKNEFSVQYFHFHNLRAHFLERVIFYFDVVHPSKRVVSGYLLSCRNMKWIVQHLFRPN